MMRYIEGYQMGLLPSAVCGPGGRSRRALWGESNRFSRRRAHVVPLRQRIYSHVVKVAVIEAPASNASHGPSNIDYTAALFIRGEAAIAAGSSLWLTVVSEEASEIRSQRFNISRFEQSEISPEYSNLSGVIPLPANLKPGVILLELAAEDADSLPQPLFLEKLTLKPAAGQAVEYIAHTSVDALHGERCIFPSRSSLPSATPAGMRAFRQQDLQLHRGTPETATQERSGGDLIYDFDLYNDLGKPQAGQIRPTLGGTPELPFPRRIRTNRGLDENGFENRIPDDAGKLPWVPIDERFTLTKERTFQGLSAYSLGAVVSSPHGFVRALLALPTLQKRLKTAEFPDLAAVDAMYDGLTASDNPGSQPGLRQTSHSDLLSGLSETLQDAGHGLAHVAESLLKKVLEVANSGKSKQQQLEDPSIAAGQLPPEEAQLLGVVKFLSGMIHRWPVPNVRKGRKDLWHTDEDFGRQVMEGQNPLVIRAMTEQDLTSFATTDEDVRGLLEGSSMSARAAEGGRMYVLDFYTHYVDFLDRINAELGPNGNPRVMYAARCILYSRNDKALVPVAIELQTAGLPLTVYTPQTDPQLWRLAKVVVASLEAWHHQAIAHLLQTHLVVEPYIISTRRCLSAMHPVFKLLQPAFRWTMRPNADARQNLISAQGVLENAFTPGKFSMQLISKIYGGSWRFDTQDFAADLISRGVAREGPNGLEVTLPGYSYAEDGLLIHKALKQWVADYTRLYYDDNTPGKRVQDDEELLAWWDSIRREGHPDKLEGWPQLSNVADLDRILLTILWTTGPHHAAVNYGQYQSSGYMPNRPTMLRKKVPLPGSKEQQEMAADFEGFMMHMMSDQISTATIMLMTKLLSHHSADEEFINDSKHSWITDADALAAHGRFVEALNAAEAEMEARNQSQERLRGGKGMPYTQMMPSIDLSTLPDEAHGNPGSQVSYRGIPNSIAI